MTRRHQFRRLMIRIRLDSCLDFDFNPFTRFSRVAGHLPSKPSPAPRTPPIPAQFSKIRPSVGHFHPSLSQMGLDHRVTENTAKPRADNLRVLRASVVQSPCLPRELGIGDPV